MSATARAAVKIHNATLVSLGLLAECLSETRHENFLFLIFFTAYKSSKLLKGLQGKVTFSTRIPSTCFIYFI